MSVEVNMQPKTFDNALVDQGMMETLTTISSSQKYNLWVYSQFKDHLSGTVLDIGSGLGDIIGQYVQREEVTRIIATDYSEDMVVQLKKRFQNDQRFQVMRMDIMSDESLHQVKPGTLDVVTCSNVMEHIEDDHNALLRIKSLLKDGGKLVILVPSIPAIYGTLDTLVGHYRRYTKKTLRSALTNAGFTVERNFYMNFFGVFTWFLAGRILKQKQFDANACRNLDKIVPFLSFLESGIKPFIGQSVIAVARK